MSEFMGWWTPEGQCPIIPFRTLTTEVYESGARSYHSKPTNKVRAYWIGSRVPLSRYIPRTHGMDEKTKSKHDWVKAAIMLNHCSTEFGEALSRELCLAQPEVLAGNERTAELWSENCARSLRRAAEETGQEFTFDPSPSATVPTQTDSTHTEDPNRGSAGLATKSATSAKTSSFLRRLEEKDWSSMFRSGSSREEKGKENASTSPDVYQETLKGRVFPKYADYEKHCERVLAASDVTLLVKQMYTSAAASDGTAVGNAEERPSLHDGQQP